MKNVLPRLSGKIRELVLVGTGPSLDLADPDEYAAREDRRVIALNGAAGIVGDADFVVLTDLLALRAWPGCASGPNQYVVTPGSTFERSGAKAAFPDIRFLGAESHVPGPKFKNARTLGLYLLYSLLNSLPSVERVAYIGMDFGVLREIGADGKDLAVWQYAARLAPHAADDRQRRRCFAGDRSNGFEYTTALPIACYENALGDVSITFTRHPRRAALDCRSFLDWIALDPRQPDYGVKKAFHSPPSRNPEVPEYRWVNPVQVKSIRHKQAINRTRVADLPLPTSKSGAHTIWVIGTGPSLDLVAPDPKAIRGDIVIAVNAAIAEYRDVATYAVVTDVEAYHRFYRPDVWPCWVVPRQTKRTLAGCTTPWRVVEDLLDPGPGGPLTSGSSAVLLAQMVAAQRALKIRRVITVALDFAALAADTNPTVPIRYPARIAQYSNAANRRATVSPGFFDAPFRIRFSTVEAYREQARRIARTMTPAFRALLDPRGFCDLRKLTTADDAGFAGAVQLPPGGEKGRLE